MEEQLSLLAARMEKELGLVAARMEKVLGLTSRVARTSASLARTEEELGILVVVARGGGSTHRRRRLSPTATPNPEPNIHRDQMRLQPPVGNTKRKI
jgi:hypothetical protein